MKTNGLLKNFVCGVLLGSSASLALHAQPEGTIASPTKSRAAIWKEIAPYFLPPAEFTAMYGDYRSPLIFYDGHRVKTKSGWEQRRKEILARWRGLMGEWPPLFKDQRLRVLDSTHREDFMQYRVSLYWTPNERTEGYLLVPDGDRRKRRPAVITVYYEPETAIGKGQPDRDFAYQLTKRGFITLSIGTSEATEAKTYALYYPRLDSATVEPLNMLAGAAANAWHALANSQIVDSTRIGIIGHSFGGKWAMFASCLYDKFACAVWSDPGIVFEQERENINYWEPWYLGYHHPPWRKRGLITPENPAHGLYPELVRDGYNLHELHALMAPRPFLVSGGEEDPPARWLALNHAVAVNDLLGVRNRVAMTNREHHAPTKESNDKAFLFFEYFLK